MRIGVYTCCMAPRKSVLGKATRRNVFIEDRAWKLLEDMSYKTQRTVSSLVREALNNYLGIERKS